ncbi:glycosyltransferase family 2 protein [Megamonas funiformis]|uniref:glycosyltransferase family 2 protein n=1 Tax=Megamonas funiformis TaxID=437897 RepID=UPI002F95257B
MSKISIIIPIYNVEQYLSQCLDSVINQTYKNLEILLINDGSTDNSGKICDNYAKLDNRIRVFHKKNEGVSSARNLGLEKCTGDFIGFVDPDDFIELNMYELLYNEQQKTNADIIWCNYCKISSTGNIIYLGEINNNTFYDLSLKNNKKIFSKNFYYILNMKTYIWNKLFKRKLFYNIRFPLKKTFEDLFIFMSLILQTNTIQFISKTLYYYRQRDTSLCATFNTSKFSLDFIEASIIFGIDYNYFYNSKKELNLYLFNIYRIALKNILFNKHRNKFQIQEKIIIKESRKLLYSNLPFKYKLDIIRRCLNVNLYYKMKINFSTKKLNF